MSNAQVPRVLVLKVDDWTRKTNRLESVELNVEFTEGPLKGLTLVGLTAWRTKGETSVEFPKALIGPARHARAFEVFILDELAKIEHDETIGQQAQAHAFTAGSDGKCDACGMPEDDEQHEAPCVECGGSPENVQGCRECCRDCGFPCELDKDSEGFHARDDHDGGRSYGTKEGSGR